MQKANTNKYIDNWCLQRPDETHEEWKIRLIVAKKNGELNGTKFPLKWSQIVSLLGESVSSDHFRKYASGVYDYYNYKNQDNVSTRVLSISDLHFPYCKPLSTFEKYIGPVDIFQITIKKKKIPGVGAAICRPLCNPSVNACGIATSLFKGANAIAKSKPTLQRVTPRSAGRCRAATEGTGAR